MNGMYNTLAPRIGKIWRKIMENSEYLRKYGKFCENIFSKIVPGKGLEFKMIKSMTILNRWMLPTFLTLLQIN